MSFDAANPIEIGQMLTGKLDGSGESVIVLDKAEDSGELLLMALSTGRSFEVAAEEVKDWTHVPPPDARWVEIYEGEDEEPFFAAYAPSLNHAIAIGRVFEQRDGDFRVEIFAASSEEQQSLG
jgi:hypothetical protein